MKFFERFWSHKPRVMIREDFRIFDMGRMKHWGYNAFWWPSEYVGERACLFGGRPRKGDVLIEGEMVYVIMEVRTMLNPDDQHFVQVIPWGQPRSALPERAPDPNDDFIF